MLEDDDHSPVAAASEFAFWWWTPYGERFGIKTENGRPLVDSEIFMSTAGIHGEQARRECVAAMAKAERPLPKGSGNMGFRQFGLYRVLLAYGGRRPPVIGIRRPLIRLGNDGPLGGCEEVNDRPSRHHELLKFMADTLGSHRAREPAYVVDTITMQLEHWMDGQIIYLPQAICYAMTAHPEWRQAARAWLLPHRHTWLRDYVRREPHVVLLAKKAAKRVPVPSWLLARG